MAREQELQIADENGALRLLQETMAGKFNDKDVELVFNNWPIIEIRFVGKGYDSTITSDIAEALIEIQNAVNRSYARMVHDGADARALTAEERKGIKFKAKVKKGSSLFEVNLGDFATKLSQDLVGKMDSTQIMITVLGLAVIGGGTLGFKWYLNKKSEDKKVSAQAEQLVALSVQETKRLDIVAQALSRQPMLRHSVDEFDDARREVLKSVGDARTVSVNGVELTREDAHQISTAPRTRAEDKQLNGHYLIRKIDWQIDEDVRLTLQSEDDHGTFVASLGQDNITLEQKEILKSAEWERKTIYMSINATVLRGEVTTARILAVSWPRQPKTK